MSRIVHDGCALTRDDLLPEFAHIPISTTKREHFRLGAIAHIDERGYGYIENHDGSNYNRIHSDRDLCCEP